MRAAADSIAERHSQSEEECMKYFTAIAAAFALGVLVTAAGVPMTVHYINHDAVASTMVKDRKSTRLNSSHRTISYAVFCLKKKKRYKLELTKQAYTYAGACSQ